MRISVPHQGKLVKAREVDRGPPVLYGGQEWSEREALAYDRYFVRHILALSAAIIVGMVLLALVILRGIPSFMLVLLLYPLSFAGTLLAMERYSRWRALRSDGFSGLFEGGLQCRMPGSIHVLFFPYQDIADFRVQPGRVLGHLLLEVRGFKRPLRMFNLDRVLGERGAQVLAQRVFGPPSPSGPPRLVVYGGSRARPSPTAAAEERDGPQPTNNGSSHHHDR